MSGRTGGAEVQVYGVVEEGIADCRDCRINVEFV